eukprot:jgi/Tetstr1/462211/TSEL_007274.t1
MRRRWYTASRRAGRVGAPSPLQRTGGQGLQRRGKPPRRGPQMPHSSEETLEGTWVSLTHSSFSDDPNEEIEEAEVFRSLWDLKVPQLTEVQQTKKMIQVLGATAMASMLSNMDKVNMAVAIVPMMTQLGWSTTVAGVLQSSFFWGYFLAQLPSGKLVSKYGGRVVLAVGVLCWSMATVAAPICAYTGIWALCFVRFLVGLFEATAPSANADLITRWAAIEERSRAVTAVWTGFNFGNVMGLLIAPFCVARWGWESVFYVFGGIGFLWSLCWYFINRRLPLPSKVACSRFEYVKAGEALKRIQQEEEERKANQHSDKIPYGAFFKVPAFWSMMMVHFGENWGKFTLMAWMPIYYQSTLGLGLWWCSALSILPYVIGIAVSTTGAAVADELLRGGWQLTKIRKMMQGLASGGAALGLTCSVLTSEPYLKVAGIAGALAMSNLSTVGLYCSHQDISPKYAGVMLSITNTAGSLPGILGNILVGFLMDRTGSWSISLMIPAITCYAIGALSWLLLYSSDPVDFDELDKGGAQDDEPPSMEELGKRALA